MVHQLNLNKQRKIFHFHYVIEHTQEMVHQLNLNKQRKIFHFHYEIEHTLDMIHQVNLQSKQKRVFTEPKKVLNFDTR